MDFDYSDDQRMLVDQLSRYLGRHDGVVERRVPDPQRPARPLAHWDGLAELGLVSALFDAAAGGLGGTGFDIAAIFEQLGRALLAEPFLGTLMAGRALSRAGGSETLLTDMMSGRPIVTLAPDEPGNFHAEGPMSTQAEAAPSGWRLTGVKAVVPHLGSAHYVLVPARIADTAVGPGDMALFLVERAADGFEAICYDTMDGAREGDLLLTGAPGKLVARSAYPVLEEALAAGVLALCWEAVGIMDVLKAATRDYLRTRRQFGTPIGTLQSLRHRLADVAIEIEQARSAAINAAAALGGSRIERERAASAAKFTIGRAGTIVAEEAIQMHGAIGMTWELPLSHYAKRLILLGHQLGDEDDHLNRYIALGRAS